MSGPTILLLHGVGSSATTWWRASEDLTELGWQTTTRDLLGHGGRPAGPSSSSWLTDLATDVAAATAGQRFDVVLGHSLGALVALTFAASHPERIGLVLLEDPPALGGSFTVGQVAADLEEATVRSRKDPTAEQQRLAAENPRWSSRDIAGVLENRRRLDLVPVTAILRNSSWDLPALVTACPRPVGVLAAEGPDTALVEPVRTQLLSALPAPHVETIVGGHGLHRDRPALWLRSVTALADTLREEPARLP